jgi:prohibitin 1
MRSVPNLSLKRCVANLIQANMNGLMAPQAEQERQAAVIRAEGEAEAAATISRALDKAGEAFVALRKIEAAKAIVQSLSTNRNVTYVPSSGGNVLLNVPVAER